MRVATHTITELPHVSRAPKPAHAPRIDAGDSRRRRAEDYRKLLARVPAAAISPAIGAGYTVYLDSVLVVKDCPNPAGPSPRTQCNGDRLSRLVLCSVRPRHKPTCHVGMAPRAGWRIVTVAMPATGQEIRGICLGRRCHQCKAYHKREKGQVTSHASPHCPASFAPAGPPDALSSEPRAASRRFRGPSRPASHLAPFLATALAALCPEPGHPTGPVWLEFSTAPRNGPASGLQRLASRTATVSSDFLGRTIPIRPRFPPGFGAPPRSTERLWTRAESATAFRLRNSARYGWLPAGS